MGAAVARIGADTAADVVMTDPTVAAMHASLHLQGGVWMLEDLGSDGGSWVDEDAVTAPHPLAPGSVIRLGTVELVFDPQDTWEASPATAVPTDAADPLGLSPARAPLFLSEGVQDRSGWLPWVLVAVVVLVAVAAILLSGGSR